MELSPQAQLKALQEQIKALQAQVPQVKTDKGITVKIGEKGTVNVYGLGKFPVCLYTSQIAKLVELFNSDVFKTFLASNADKLATKN
jgi:hypothetical protein